MADMLRQWQRVREEQDAATATEYIVLLVFIALAIIIGATILGGGINSVFGDACDQLAGDVAGAECEAPEGDGGGGGGEGE